MFFMMHRLISFKFGSAICYSNIDFDRQCNGFPRHLRTLRNWLQSCWYRKTQSSNGCLMFSSGMQVLWKTLSFYEQFKESFSHFLWKYVEKDLDCKLILVWIDFIHLSSQGTTSQNDLEKTIEGLYLSIKQRKYQLYRQAGETKKNTTTKTDFFFTWHEKRHSVL